MSSQSSMIDNVRAIMPPLIRLLAGIIVLIVIQATVLGFPGLTQFIPGTSLTIASMILFTLGLVVAGIVLKFGTQLAEALRDAYNRYRTCTPPLAYRFPLTALVRLSQVAKTQTSTTLAPT